MVNYLQIFKQLESLQGEGSQKLKQDLIKKNLDSDFSYLLDICFNPFITTKLHKLNFIEPPEGKKIDLWQNFKQLVEELKVSPASNDSLRNRAELLVSIPLIEDPNEDQELREVLKKILTKRMNIGIGAKLINKAVGWDLIPDPSPMLATDEEDKVESWSSICCEEKYDGVRVICVKENGALKFFTRAFNELDPKYLQKISEEILLLSSAYDGLFFDGELTDFDRKSVSGKVTQMLKGSPHPSIGDQLLFNVFDTDSLESLKSGKGTRIYNDRRAFLQNLFTGKIYKNIKIAQQWQANSKSEILQVYENIVKNGGEGVILKDPHHVYECKRSKSWVKYKQVQDCDLLILGWYPGEGKREGLIGGLILSDQSRTLNVRVGAGFTDKDLEILSADPDSLIGQIAAIQYNVPISDKNGNKSLFLPRFIEIRYDKSIADDFSGVL